MGTKVLVDDHSFFLKVETYFGVVQDLTRLFWVEAKKNKEAETNTPRSFLQRKGIILGNKLTKNNVEYETAF